MAVAVKTADTARLEPFAPFLGFKRLSPRGIIVSATTLGRTGTPTEFPPLRWPPRLASFRLDHAWEGQPALNIQQRLTWGHANGWNLDLHVYFATQHPDQRLLERAQAELRRLRLPPRR
jgi:hypothetical protein